jgi:D-alanine-D-alanine ligase
VPSWFNSEAASITTGLPLARDRTVAERSVVAKMARMKVTVLYGGPSSEREVSLVSGAAVIEGLKQAGHEVFASDVSPANLSGLDRPCDVVFPVLHGEFGEDGQLQSILEERGLKFVGSGSKASSVAIDKVATKQVWQRHGIPTPAFHIADHSDVSSGSVTGACVVKSIKGGSSIGVHVFKDATSEECLTCIGTIVAKENSALVEQFVRGREITVGILEEKSLPPIRIVYEQGFFDYDAKYSAGGAKHDFETGLDAGLLATIRSTVEKAHAVLGCRDLSRTDVMIDEAGRYYLLEINTLPGFTPRSLLPEAAAKTGIEFSALVDRLVKRAVAR